jgi:hypothetical protein
MWRKAGDIAARSPRPAHSLIGANERDAKIAVAMDRHCRVSLRHADAHDCRANESMEVYKRCRQECTFSTAILSHSTT